MKSQQFWILFFRLTWISVFFLPSVCSQDAPSISLNSTVFVAFKGEDLNVNCTVTNPTNQTEDNLTCFDPHKTPIYHQYINKRQQNFELQLKKLNITGKYYCQYQTAKVDWFLRVRDEGYKAPLMLDYTEFTIVAVFTGVLLILSVLGSVYVFRGHWKEKLTEHAAAGRKQKQSREERKGKKMEEDNVDATAAQSTSFYASLEPRPRSIYDVLDPSPASKEQDQKTAKPKKKELQQKVAQKTEDQDEGVFESVYENF